jgi:fibronectin-binding autotransporter adhesin
VIWGFFRSTSFPLEVHVNRHRLSALVSALGFAAIVLSWVAPQAVRADVYWNGSVDADWANVANWTGGGPGEPGAGNAIINPGSPNPTPTVSTLGNTTVGQIYISIGAGLNVTGGSLASSDLITGLWGDSGLVSVSGGQLSLSGYLNMSPGGNYDGDVSISGGALESAALSIATTKGAQMIITGTGSYVTSASQLGNVSYWVAHQAIVTSGAGRYVNIDTTSQPGKLVLTSALRTTTDIVWDNGSGDSQWTTPTNWNPDGLPGIVDTARINNELSAFLTGSAGSVNAVVIGDAINNGALNVQGAGSLTAGTITVGPTGNSNAYPSYYSHAAGDVATTGNMIFGANGGRSQSYFTAGTLQVGGTMQLGSAAGAGASSLALNGGGGTITAGSLEIGSAGSLDFDFLGGTSLKTLSVTSGISLTGSSALTVRNAGSVTLGASYTLLDGLSLSGTFGSVTFDGFASGLVPALVYDRAIGNLRLTVGQAAPTITINVGSGTQTQTQAGYPLLSGTTPVEKTGAGTLLVDQANTLTASTTIQQGTVKLANGSALGASRIVPVAGGTLSLTPGLQTTVGGLAANAGGLTDVGNGLVTVAAGLPAADLVTALLSGRGDGSWNGSSGITSTAAAAALAQSVPRTVGWLDNGDGSVAFAFAAPGDTNIDWAVDILDAANFLAGGKFDSGTPATWIEGDFGYDGVVDILDAADFLSTGLFDAGAYNAAAPTAGGIAAVPEPAAWPLAAAALGCIATRRLRRRVSCGAGVTPPCVRT